MVVDTPMLPTRGKARLLAARAVAALRDELLPRATLVTVNADEAGVLLGEPVRTVGEAHDAARALVTKGGARAALVKGGHLDGATRPPTCSRWGTRWSSCGRSDCPERERTGRGAPSRRSSRGVWPRGGPRESTAGISSTPCGGRSACITRRCRARWTWGEGAGAGLLGDARGSCCPPRARYFTSSDTGATQSLCPVVASVR